MTNEQATTHTGGGLFKELVIMFGLIGLLVTLLTAVGALYWIQSVPGAASAGTPSAAGPVESARAKVMAPAPDVPVLHADVYFDFKSVRLRADAARMLQDNAAVMTRTEAWAVLVTGYADHQGPPAYNRNLAQRRAEAVKQFLVELGVPETSVKVVAVGQEATLCDDPGQECQQLNRRVHLEIRNLGPVAQVKVGPKSDEVATP
jgi:outer membrane protein OmpA-like peptidoglycan-associated protein